MAKKFNFSDEEFSVQKKEKDTKSTKPANNAKDASNDNEHMMHIEHIEHMEHIDHNGHIDQESHQVSYGHITFFSISVGKLLRYVILIYGANLLI